jgi:hypothetical protein
MMPVTARESPIARALTHNNYTVSVFISLPSVLPQRFMASSGVGIARDESSDMDMTFWIGLGIGALLSVLGSIIANVYHDRIISILGNRKLAAQSNRYTKAEKIYNLVRELHSGERDKYIYMSSLAFLISLFATVGFAP